MGNVFHIHGQDYYDNILVREHRLYLAIHFLLMEQRV